MSDSFKNTSQVQRGNNTWYARPDKIYRSQNGLVEVIIDAGARQQHLVLRPDQVWHQILVQVGFYVSSHSDLAQIQNMINTTRKHRTDAWLGGWSTDTYGPVIMESFIKSKDRTNWLANWVSGRFSTTTNHDNATANALLFGNIRGMNTESKNQYILSLCTIPSITLKGTEQDWMKLLQKLDRLVEFGAEVAEYGRYLRPVLSGFVQTWKDSNSPIIRKFWSNILSNSLKPEGTRMVCEPPGSPLSGWITAFMYWDSKGRRLPLLAEDDAEDNEEPTLAVTNRLKYLKIDPASLPVAYTTIRSFTSADSPCDGPTEWRAGLFGHSIKKGMPKGYKEALEEAEVVLGDEDLEREQTMLEPISAWFWYHGNGDDVTEADGKHCWGSGY
ncbi:hypothetical protein BT63DRAFT_380145 [Microthyrium microscopicum]|uniref:Uncharacterized protein n=1 Tax=Microthyrium microscopicum TaxID=703497 RepID=A0A6A6TTH3_9PEZI|nr:hypothetical protein BT63DRAFT_380145 [Microthyrium microscopicum]